MAQVVLARFYWTSFRTRDGKYIRIRFIFSICKTALVIFCSRQGTRLTSVQFVVFNPLWSFSQSTHCWCQLSLVFKSPSSKKGGQSRTKPSAVTGQDSSCRPVQVHRSQIISSAALSRLLFCGQRWLFFPFSLGLSRKCLKPYLPR